jgi:hypothetical protein
MNSIATEKCLYNFAEFDFVMGFAGFVVQIRVLSKGQEEGLD